MMRRDEAGKMLDELLAEDCYGGAMPLCPAGRSLRMGCGQRRFAYDETARQGAKGGKEMRFGPVLTYRDIDEAKRLIGKKVVASDFYAFICDDDTACDCVHDTLKAVHAGKACPFECNDFYGAQFIREILPDKPVYVGCYEPYDFSDPKVRDSMRGRWYRTKSGNEYQVTEFMAPNKFSDEWVFGGFCAATFLNSCTWLEDGTPCGRRVE